MRIVGRALAVVCLLPACATFGGGSDGDCRLADSPEPWSGQKQTKADLSAAKPFRNYLAVTEVGPAGHHFTVWFHHIEPNVYRVRAERDATGTLRLHFESGAFGGIGAPPERTPPPAEVAELARAVEAELRNSCRSGTDWVIAYDGAYREVHVAEFIAHDLRTGTWRSGWSATQTLRADAALTRLVGPAVESMSGFGRIEVPAAAHWVSIDRPIERDGRVLLSGQLDAGGKLTERVLEIARHLDAGLPTATLEAVGPAASAELVSRDYVSRVVAVVRFFGVRRRERWERGGQELRLPLDLRDAVFGEQAVATGETTVGQIRLAARATLAPAVAATPSPVRTEQRYRGTLTVHLEDGEGHSWDRSYSPSGSIIVEGRDVVAPAGLVLPGASAPSPEADALKGNLAVGGANPGTLQFAVDVSLFDDPRRP